MTKKEKVVQWLKDKGVYEQFAKNFTNKELPIDCELIARAFTWGGTPEGFDFWGRIDERYVEWYSEEFADEFLYKNEF